jgi:hypothetical protein
MQDHSAKKTCFISAPAGTDLSVLTAALEGHGYAVVAPTSFGAGQQWLDVLTESLRTVDLVIGVFSADGAVANATFELGYALGIGKRALVIASPKAADLPFAFSGLMVIRAEPTDHDAIEFALDRLPVNPLLRRPKPPSPDSEIPTLTGNIDEYVQRAKSAQNEHELLHVLQALFMDSGVEIVAGARFGERRADFAIWSDLLGTYVGNPLIIEVKRNLRTSNDVAGAVAQLMSLINAAGALWGLLLYVEGPEKSRIEVEARHAPQVLMLSLDELFEHLRRRSFFDVIRALRNRKVHGVDR